MIWDRRLRIWYFPGETKIGFVVKEEMVCITYIKPGHKTVILQLIMLQKCEKFRIRNWVKELR